MPVILRLENHDQLFQEAKKRLVPIFINDLPNSTEEDKERIRSLTLNQLNSDTISIVPKCGCGFTQGRYALGKTCPACGDIVRSTIDESITSVLWFRKPEFVDRLMNPVVTAMLGTYFTKNSHNAIQYLTDSTYQPGNRVPVEMDKLAGYGLERNFNVFTGDFEKTLGILMSVFKEKPNKPYRELVRFLEDNQDAIFSDVQPILNRTLFVMDQTNLGVYMESSIQGALDAINHVISIDRDFHDRTPRTIINRTARMQSRMAAFYDGYISSNFQPKPGHTRRQVYGNRVVFCGRGVISSITGELRDDIVGVPWCMAVPLFQHHLMGMLMRHGFNYNSALGYIYRHVHVYDTLLHKFLKQIFDEAPGGRGPSFILHRNQLTA